MSPEAQLNYKINVIKAQLTMAVHANIINKNLNLK